MSIKIYPKLILDALRNVRYPGTGKDVVEMGFVSDDIHIDGNKISFSLLFDKPNDPFIKSVVKACETAILTYVDPAVEIKGNIDVQTKEIKQTKTEVSPILPKVKNIIAIASGKGGVGKSTITTNLAVSLAQKGYKVGLLDADVFGPSIPKMFQEEEARPLLEMVDGKELIAPVEKYGVKILSIGFFINKESAIVWRGAMAGNALKQLLNDGNWGELDYFFIDLPPGTSDIHLTLVQTLGITGAVIVTTPQEIALIDARKAVDLFTNDKVNIPILGVVENMSWFTPEELPNNKYYLFGKDGGKKLAKEIDSFVLGEIPLVQSVREGGDEGLPIALDLNTLVSASFSALADNFVAAVDQRNSLLGPTQKVEIQK